MCLYLVTFTFYYYLLFKDFDIPKIHRFSAYQIIPDFDKYFVFFVLVKTILRMADHLLGSVAVTMTVISYS